MSSRRRQKYPALVVVIHFCACFFFFFSFFPFYYHFMPCNDESFFFSVTCVVFLRSLRKVHHHHQARLSRQGRAKFAWMHRMVEWYVRVKLESIRTPCAWKLAENPTCLLKSMSEVFSSLPRHVQCRGVFYDGEWMEWTLFCCIESECIRIWWRKKREYGQWWWCKREECGERNRKRMVAVQRKAGMCIECWLRFVKL